MNRIQQDFWIYLKFYPFWNWGASRAWLRHRSPRGEKKKYMVYGTMRNCRRRRFIGDSRALIYVYCYWFEKFGVANITRPLWLLRLLVSDHHSLWNVQTRKKYSCLKFHTLAEWTFDWLRQLFCLLLDIPGSRYYLSLSGVFLATAFFFSYFIGQGGWYKSA